MIKIFKSKTIIFSSLLAALSVIDLNSAVLKEFITPDVYPIITLTISVIIAVLRVLTSKPLKEK